MEWCVPRIPLASQIGLDILKQGGNAIDAAIAANAALGLMEPTGCGVGGDLFAIVWDAKTQKLYGLNGSGRSPKSMSLDTLKAMGLEKIPAYGPLPVSVPGAVDGWTSHTISLDLCRSRKFWLLQLDMLRKDFP